MDTLHDDSNVVRTNIFTDGPPVHLIHGLTEAHDQLLLQIPTLVDADEWAIVPGTRGFASPDASLPSRSRAAWAISGRAG